MRQSGPIKGYIVFVNDTTGESTFFIAEPLHVNGNIYNVLMNGGGAIKASTDTDDALNINYFDTASITAASSVSLGTGDGTVTNFTGSAGAKTYSVSITAGGTEVAKDDGTGKIVGTALTAGTIDYATGAIDITFETAPASGTVIAAAVIADTNV